MNDQNKRRIGFTLIEVLLVVSILLILTSILIPRLRVINKERSLRESARVTGSLFAQASQRAIADGVAGVLLRYNSNFADPTNGYSFAVSNMALLRAVPPFAGDQSPVAGVGAFQGGSAGVVTINYPIEQDDLQIVKPGDSISFGQSATQYTITAVVPMPATSPTTLELALDASYLPDPNGFIEGSMANPGTAYTIRRLPRVLQSSEVALPENYIVDLRFSGFTMQDTGYEQKIDNSDNVRAVDSSTGTNRRTTTVFEPNPRVASSPAPVNFTTSDIAILFNQRGEIDRMARLGSDLAGNTFVLQELAVDNLRLFVTEIDANPDSNDPDDNPLNDEDNLWVTVNRSTGNVNVGYNDPNNSNLSLNDLNNLYFGSLADRETFNVAIAGARGFSATQSAQQ